MNKYFLILALLASASSFAELNKWVDESGKVHYSDRPPPSGVKAKTIRSTSSSAMTESASGVAASSAVAAPKSLAEREAELRKAQQAKKEAAEKADKEKAAEEEKQANCNAAQKNLLTLQSGVRMLEINEKGERSYLSDEQRQIRITKAQQDVSAYCK